MMYAEWTMTPRTWALALGVSCALWAVVIGAGMALVGAL